LNNFYTVLVIPEKTKQVKKIVLPSIYVRVGFLLGSVGIFFLAFMVYDYVNVMRQLSENKRLQTENRQLKQQMQAFTTKLQTVQDALERIQTYTTKLRIITNQAGENTENLKKKVAPDIPGLPMDDHSDLPPAKAIPSGRESRLSWPLDRSRLIASTETSDAVKVAEGNSAVSPEPEKATAPASPSPLNAPVPTADAAAEAMPPAPVVVAKPRRRPKPKATKTTQTSIDSSSHSEALSPPLTPPPQVPWLPLLFRQLPHKPKPPPCWHRPKSFPI